MNLDNRINIMERQHLPLTPGARVHDGTQAPCCPVDATGYKMAGVFFENIVLYAQYALPASTVSFQMGCFYKPSKVVVLQNRNDNIPQSKGKTLKMLALRANDKLIRL